MSRRRKPDHVANARLARAFHERQREAARKAAAKRNVVQCGPVTVTRPDGTTDVHPPLTPAQLRRVAPERLPIDPTLRHRVLSRDGYACRYCGATGELIMEHVIPVIKGGATHMGNLVAACVPCNARKGTEVWAPKPLRLSDA